MKISTKPTEDALNNLKEALLIPKPTDLERDGTIQRFEYCYELLWKLGQRVLKEHEVHADVPKAVIRELGRLGWITSVESWLEFQRIRNETSHEYGLALANKSMQLAKIFYPLATELLVVLKDKSNE